MSDIETRLSDFLAWVKIRRPIQPNARVDEETLEIVAQGIERFLEGKNPWTKPRGRKAKTDLMWQCYWEATFVKAGCDPLPLHCQDGGAYTIVSKHLNIAPQTVESHVANARKLVKTSDGMMKFSKWLNACGNQNVCLLYDSKHPANQAHRAKQQRKPAVSD